MKEAKTTILNVNLSIEVLRNRLKKDCFDIGIQPFIANTERNKDALRRAAELLELIDKLGLITRNGVGCGKDSITKYNYIDLVSEANQKMKEFIRYNTSNTSNDFCELLKDIEETFYNFEAELVNLQVDSNDLFGSIGSERKITQAAVDLCYNIAEKYQINGETITVPLDVNFEVFTDKTLKDFAGFWQEYTLYKDLYDYIKPLILIEKLRRLKEDMAEHIHLGTDRSTLGIYTALANSDEYFLGYFKDFLYNLIGEMDRQNGTDKQKGFNSSFENTKDNFKEIKYRINSLCEILNSNYSESNCLKASKEKIMRRDAEYFEKLLPVIKEALVVILKNGLSGEFILSKLKINPSDLKEVSNACYTMFLISYDFAEQRQNEEAFLIDYRKSASILYNFVNNIFEQLITASNKLSVEGLLQNIHKISNKYSK